MMIVDAYMLIAGWLGKKSVSPSFPTFVGKDSAYLCFTLRLKCASSYLSKVIIQQSWKTTIFFVCHLSLRIWYMYFCKSKIHDSPTSSLKRWAVSEKKGWSYAVVESSSTASWRMASSLSRWQHTACSRCCVQWTICTSMASCIVWSWGKLGQLGREVLGRVLRRWFFFGNQKNLRLKNHESTP